jgi:hypothetical protein
MCPHRYILTQCSQSLLDASQNDTLKEHQIWAGGARQKLHSRKWMSSPPCTEDVKKDFLGDMLYPAYFGELHIQSHWHYSLQVFPLSGWTLRSWGKVYQQNLGLTVARTSARPTSAYSSPHLFTLVHSWDALSSLSPLTASLPLYKWLWEQLGGRLTQRLGDTHDVVISA